MLKFEITIKSGNTRIIRAGNATEAIEAIKYLTDECIVCCNEI